MRTQRCLAAVLCCGLLLLASIPVAAQQSDAARKATEAAAEKGNPVARYALGAAAEDEGRFVDAVSWYQKAANQGYGRAQLKLAHLLETGQGVTRDPAQAQEWSRKAAAHGASATSSPAPANVERKVKISIFVGPQTRDGFVDVDRGVIDSIKDIKSELASKNAIQIVGDKTQAQVTLEVLSQGATSSNGGGAVAAPIGTTTFVIPIGTIGIAAVLRVGTYEKPIVFQNCQAWRYCARLVADDVGAWLDATLPSDIHGEPDPFALTPLAKTPLVLVQGRFYLFVPGLLFQSLLYAFHTRLLGDASYRPHYDKARAQWLEQSAIESVLRIVPHPDQSGWGLVYGPKRTRLELDGLLLYDNKLILVECKWKSPRLVALAGNVGAVLEDVEKAIVEPLAQAKRARDYITEQATAEFIEESTGRRVVVRAADVAEVFLVTLVGSGAWAHIAANLQAFVPLGLFADGEFPWAVSLNDLRLVSTCLELPSQLFDYLRRRDRMQRDGRFRLHDEWDYLGVYLTGALDPEDPRFPKDVDAIALDGFDGDLQEYCYTLVNSHAGPIEKPRRKIPKNVFDLLMAAERVRTPRRSDAICTVLGWSDDGLVELSDMLREVRRKAIWDGRAHAVVARHPWKNTGIALSCGYKNRRKIQETLLSAVELSRKDFEAVEWAGFGIDLASIDSPLVVYYP